MIDGCLIALAVWLGLSLVSYGVLRWLCSHAPVEEYPGQYGPED